MSAPTKESRHAAEKAFTAIVLSDPTVLDEFIDVITPVKFRDARLRLLIASTIAVRKSGALVGPAEIERAQEPLKKSQVYSGIREWTAAEMVDFENAEWLPVSRAQSYVDTIVDGHLRDSIVATQRELIDEVDHYDNANDLLSAAFRRLEELMIETREPDTCDLGEVACRVMDRLNRQRETNEVPSLQCGLRFLDESHSIRKTHLTIIGGRPSMGKTALGLNIYVRLQEAGFKGLFNSLEQSRDELTERLLCEKAGVSSTKISRPATLNNDEIGRLMTARTSLAQGVWPAFEPRSDYSGERIEAAVRRQKILKGLDFIVVDYLDKIIEPGPDIRARVSAAAERMKRIAKQYDIAVILLAQLSRGCDRRPDPRPLASDLKESGKVEEEADHILFPFRPWVYDKKRSSTEAEILIRKNRGGAVGSFGAYFVGKYFRFLDRGAHDPAEWQE